MQTYEVLDFVRNNSNMSQENLKKLDDMLDDLYDYSWKEGQLNIIENN